MYAVAPSATGSSNLRATCRDMSSESGWQSAAAAHSLHTHKPFPRLQSLPTTCL